jgi:hypothetical protein
MSPTGRSVIDSRIEPEGKCTTYGKNAGQTFPGLVVEMTRLDQERRHNTVKLLDER